MELLARASLTGKPARVEAAPPAVDNANGRHGSSPRKEDTRLTDARRHSRHPKQARESGAARYRTAHRARSPTVSASPTSLHGSPHPGLVHHPGPLWPALLVGHAPQGGPGG